MATKRVKRRGSDLEREARRAVEGRRLGAGAAADRSADADAGTDRADRDYQPPKSTDIVRAYRVNRRGYLHPVNYCWSPKDRDGTAKRKAQFLKIFAETGSVTVATIAIKSWRSNVYKWRREDPEFAAAWQEIWDATVDELETSMMQRAIHGYQRPVYQQGRLVGHETVHHPQVGQFMLSRSRPDRYGDTMSQQAAGPAEYARMVRESTAEQDAAAKSVVGKKKE